LHQRCVERNEDPEGGRIRKERRGIKLANGTEGKERKRHLGHTQQSSKSASVARSEGGYSWISKGSGRVVLEKLITQERKNSSRNGLETLKSKASYEGIREGKGDYSSE